MLDTHKLDYKGAFRFSLDTNGEYLFFAAEADFVRQLSSENLFSEEIKLMFQGYDLEREHQMEEDEIFDTVENAGNFLHKFNSGVYPETATDILNRGNDFYEFFGYMVLRRGVLLANRSKNEIDALINLNKVTQDSLDIAELLVCDFAFRKLYEMSKKEYGFLESENNDKADLVNIFNALFKIYKMKSESQVDVGNAGYLNNISLKWGALASYLDN